jgi:8-oxo-dGTP pyrophosphatase MutT (NUDIX family)
MKIRASAIITKDNQILLIHRKKEGKEYWVFPGGVIEENEKAEETIAREIKEETGLEILSCKFDFDYVDENDIKHPVFRCRVGEGKPVLGGPEAEKHSKDNWYHPEWISLKKANNLNVYPEKGKVVINKLVKQIEG